MADPFVKFTPDQGRRIARTVLNAEAAIGDNRPERTDFADGRRTPSPHFAVRLYKDGGTAGSASADCTWTYTVKTCSGRTLGTAMSPLVRRLTNTEYTTTPDGSVGAAFFDETGTLQLWDANETPALEDC